MAVLLLHIHKHPGFALFMFSCVHTQITVTEVSKLQGNVHEGAIEDKSCGLCVT